MTQEDKELLLKDLCARLPYGLIIHLVEPNEDEELYCLNIPQEGLYTRSLEHNNVTTLSPIEDIKPYLRPMSSMTEEEEEELKEIGSEYLAKWENAQDSIDKWRLDAEVSYKRSEFYNSHFLDWHELIPKGLALEAPDGMYNLNK